jgi:hypothetical protein
MASTLGDAPTDGPDVAVGTRRAPMALVTGAFVLLVLLIVVA